MTMETVVRSAFERGTGYTRRAIHEVIGGGTRAALPSKGGRIVGICITRRMNPLAPRVVLVADRKAALARARDFAVSGDVVPLFLKRGPKDWEYVGDSRVRSCTDDVVEVRALAVRAGRDNIGLVLFMEPCAP